MDLRLVQTKGGTAGMCQEQNTPVPADAPGEIAARICVRGTRSNRP